MSENERRNLLERELSEIRAEALLYREKLEDCYESARRAIEANNVAALYELTPPLPGFRVPPTEVARTSGMDLMHARGIEPRALETAKGSLVKIRTLAGELGNEGCTERLREQILA